MDVLRRRIFAGCLITSLALDAALLQDQGLLPISAPIKALIMAPLGFFAMAGALRRSTYARLDTFAIMGLLLLFFSSSFVSAFPYDSLSRAIRQLFLVLVYLSAIYLLRFGSLNRQSFALLAATCLLIMVPTVVFLSFNPLVEHKVQAAGPYSLLWLLLFSLLVCTPRDKLLIIMIVIGSLALLLTMKRGAILSLGLALIYWLYLKNRYFHSLSTILNTILLGVLGAGLIGVFWFTRGEQFSERLSDTSGSGRDVVYSTILDGFLKADISEILFGHGSMGVQILTGEKIGLREYARYGLQAHNDWLTLAYDFGLLGLTLFLLVHLALFKKTGQLKKLRPDLFVKLRPIHAAIFASSFFSEILFNTSLTFAYLLLAIMASADSYARVDPPVHFQLGKNRAFSNQRRKPL